MRYFHVKFLLSCRGRYCEQIGTVLAHYLYKVLNKPRSYVCAFQICTLMHALFASTTSPTPATVNALKTRLSLRVWTTVSTGNIDTGHKHLDCRTVTLVYLLCTMVYMYVFVS